MTLMEPNRARIFKRGGLTAVLLLLALPWVFYFPAWLRPMAISDNFVEEWNDAVFIFDSLRHGLDPIWNPYICCGFPVAGFPKPGIYSIPGIFHLILPHITALTFIIMSIHGFSGLGAYLFLRRTGISVEGAFVGGVTWSFSGFLLNTPLYSYFMAGTAFTGFVLWALEGVRRAVGLRKLITSSIVAATLLSVQFLAGHPHPTVISGLIYAAYIIWFSVRGSKGLDFRFLACSAVILISAAILTAMQWMPELELLRYSYRSDIGYGRFTVLSSEPFNLLANIFFMNTNNYEYIFFVGVPAILLASKQFRAKTNKSVAGFLTVCAAFSVFLGLGKYNPFYRLLYYVPLLNKLTAPNRYSLVFCFAVSCLAAMGWDNLRTMPEGSWNSKPRKWGLIFMAVVFVLASIKGGLWDMLLMFPSLLAGLIYLAAERRWARKKVSERAFVIAIVATIMLPGWSRWGGPVFEGNDPRPEPAKHWSVVEDIIKGNPESRIMDFIDLRYPIPSVVRKLPAHNLNIYLKWSDAAGYQPLMLDRYARLFDMDLTGYIFNPQLTLNRMNRAMDLLNVRCVLVPTYYFNDDRYLTNVPYYLSFKGIKLVNDLDFKLKAGEQASFRVGDVAGSSNGLAVLSLMSFSRTIHQGQEVAELTLTSANGERRDLKLRAGIDIAETIYNPGEKNATPVKTVHGIPFFKTIDLKLWAGLEQKFSFPARRLKGIYILSYLYNAEDIPQDEPVAVVEVEHWDGSKREYPLRAGVDTAQWSLGAPSVQVAHRAAQPGEFFNSGGVPGHNFLAHIKIDPPVTASSVTVKCLLKREGSGIAISNISFLEDSGKYSYPDTEATMHGQPQHLPRLNEDEGYIYFSNLDFPPIIPKMVRMRSLIDKPSGAEVVIKGLTFLGTNGKNLTVHPVEVALGDKDRFDIRYKDDVAMVYENKRCLPRAWFAEEWAVLQPETVLKTITTGLLPNGKEFDPLKTALLEQHVPGYLPSGRGEDIRKPEIRFEKYSENYIRVKTSNPRQAFLVFSEVYYPGWETEVDGRPAQTLQTDYVLRSVLLGSGSHEVVMKFDPRPVVRGRMISLAAFAFLMAALALTWLPAGRKK